VKWTSDRDHKPSLTINTVIQKHIVFACVNADQYPFH